MNGNSVIDVLALIATAIIGVATLAVAVASYFVARSALKVSTEVADLESARVLRERRSEVATALHGWCEFNWQSPEEYKKYEFALAGAIKQFEIDPLLGLDSLTGGLMKLLRASNKIGEEEGHEAYFRAATLMKHSAQMLIENWRVHPASAAEEVPFWVTSTLVFLDRPLDDDGNAKVDRVRYSDD